jgi:hypothetical protein
MGYNLTFGLKLVGRSIAYGGDVAPFLSLLRASDALQVGRGTSFGMGRYEMRLQNHIEEKSDD